MDKDSSDNHESWAIQLAMSESAMADQNYLQVITLSTQSLDKLMDTHVLKLLGLRAAAYEKRGLLSRALEDAMRMIQYVPLSPAGYLSAGSIHMVNGKPALAVDCYTKALNVIPKDHVQYLQIQDECAKASQRAQQRFDIVGNLPREIIYVILTNLEFDRVWVCLKVSKKWCQQVSRCGTWWNSVTVKQTGTDIDKAVCDAIPLVKDYIQRLEITDLSSTELNKRYLMYFKYGTFTSLKELILRGAFFKYIVSEDLAIALWQLRGTLTSLNVDFTSENQFPLLMILGSCPDITNLYYRTTSEISAWSEGAGYASACKKLSNLQLCYSDMHYSALCFHLSFCPNLRRLILKSSSAQPLGDPSSAALTNLCPRLKILGLDCTEGLPALEDFKCSTSQKGIEYMAIEFNQHFIPTESAKHINAQSQSLRQLSIIQTKKWHVPFGVNTAPTVLSTYNNLNALYYKSQRFDDASTFGFVQQPAFGAGQQLAFGAGQQPAFGVGGPRNNFGARNPAPVSVEQQYIGAIIQNSPNLADLSLVGGSFSVSHIRTPLEQAVKEKIQVLTLNSALFRDTSADWHKSFYSSFSQVHTLVIQEILLNTGVISSLAASESIQHLTITKCGNFENGELTDFFKGVALRPSHRLSTFNISDMSAPIEVSTIRHLITIKSLATIRIAKVRNINSDAVEYLIGNSTYSSLKTIEILNCFSANTISSWSSTIDSVKNEGITCRIE